MKTQTLKTTLASLLLAIILISTYSCSNEKKDSNKVANNPVGVTVHGAALMGDTQSMEKLIKAKVDLNQKDEYGSTGLSIAATFNKPEIAKMLVEAGADLSIQSADGSTALHTAAFFGRTEIVEILLAKGIDTKVRNNFGITAQESIQAPFANVKMIYDQIAKDLGPLGLKLDYDQIKSARPTINKMINDHLSSL